ncbi:MAG: type II secretion system GspH family protein [Puniceicoccales bacterium]|nr:type II secretion system GspH family protein [Puniceicoccales bacterium]
MSRFQSKASLSLVELAAIISIIAVLMTILFPAVGKIIDRFQRARAAKNLKMIAFAHANFIADFGRAIRFSDLSALKNGSTSHCDANLFAAVLAKHGYIKDASVWAWDFDHLVKNYGRSHPLPTKIYDASTDRIAPEFAGPKTGGDFPLSVACCVVQCPGFDYAQLLNPKFPCACSRGLCGDGRWQKKSASNGGGIWGDRGGLIAFFDGHVEWFGHIINRFKKYNSTATTSSLCETLPNCHTENLADSCFVNWAGDGLSSGIHN